MKLSTLEAIFRALAEEDVRFLVAGGVAVNVHGYQRATEDLDLVLDLGRENVLRALRALQALGYRPTLPVPAEDFADAETRRTWHEDRNVEVFSLTSHRHPETTVDLFVREPFDFDEEYAEALMAELAPGLQVPFVRLTRLVRMKEATDRPRDRDDAQHLRWILGEAENENEEPGHE